MINAKEAAKNASDYFSDLRGINRQYISLEEVELVEDENAWYITLSYPTGADMLGVVIGRNVREYKVFKVRAGDGEILSMKIRTVE